MSARALWTVARHELADSRASRRVWAALILYVAGAVGATLMFLHVLGKIEQELVKSMGLTPAEGAGGVTRTLWHSDAFREILRNLVGDPAVADALLGVPPLAVFFAWLSFTFLPPLIMLSSAGRIAEDVWSGTARYVVCRIPRGTWCAGKLLGQALQLAAALLLATLAAWATGWIRMAGFPPGEALAAMLTFALRVWFDAFACLGIAMGISCLFVSPHLATVAGFVALALLSLANALLWHGGTDRGWELCLGLRQILPNAHELDLWRRDWPHLLHAATWDVAIGLGAFLAGYRRLARRDL